MRLSAHETVTFVLAQAPPPADPGGQGEDFGKSSPVGLVLLILFGIAVAFLIRSMTKHLKKVPASFEAGSGDSSANPGGSGPGAEPGGSEDSRVEPGGPEESSGSEEASAAADSGGSESPESESGAHETGTSKGSTSGAQSGEPTTK